MTTDCCLDMGECSSVKGNMSAKPLILASASPRRRSLLESVGVHFEVVLSNVDEDGVFVESPQDYTLHVARRKALSVAELHPDRWVLAADTAVILQDGNEFAVLGKPIGYDDAVYILNSLSGREHTVFTSYVLQRLDSGQLTERTVETQVLFRSLSPADIERYLALDEHGDKAGAYAVQGGGSFMIESVRGSFTNVIGLPLTEVVGDLRGLGILSAVSSIVLSNVLSNGSSKV